MNKVILLLVTIGLAGLLMVAGCKKPAANEPPAPPAKPKLQPAATGPEQYREEAVKQITSDNANEELERLRAEIEADQEEPTVTPDNAREELERLRAEIEADEEETP